MRQAFAHEATLEMGPAADLRAPGAAITVELCGAWEHEPPCPLAPHHSEAHRAGDEVRVRILFAAEPESEQTVRARIDTALSSGQFRGPDGVTTRWRSHASQPSEIAGSERDHARRLLAT